MNKKLQRLRALFSEIRDVLVAEGESNWINGIDLIIRKIDSQDGDCAEKIKKVSETFESMYAGNGSFSDFMIWRDDFQERKKSNQYFEGLIDEVWSIFHP
ncbi:DUF6966 domain-containing protein [Microbulbifer sp. ZKSA006]|uniref:DUF6966 domain-containing protein n=1 Tax=Microbulbifer sp. ZKSA006 TaxID=3243390 RepID=UPI00403A5BB8